MVKKAGQPTAALVTGGAKRIGQHLALHLAQKGYDIALHYHHSREDAEKTAARICQQGVQCRLFRSDLSQERSVGGLIAEVLKIFPRLEILINNASVFSPSSIKEASLKNFHHHLNTNFLAAYKLIKDFINHCPQGQIINIIDTHYTRNMISHADYILSKKLLADLTKLAARDSGPRFRVNGIAPGLILPPPGRGEEYLKKKSTNIPLRKTGTPEHLAHALQFLMDNDFVTGQIIFVDGGEHLI